MDYEKKYNEALERAKKLFFPKRGVLIKKQALEFIFPELKESEDERIKKKILHKMRACQKASNFFGDEEIAWLEKQGEQKTVDWSEEDERIWKAIIGYIDHDQHYDVSNKDMIAWLERWKAKEDLDRMAPIYENKESFESALEKAWKFYNDSGARTVDSCEDNYIECAFSKGFREGFLYKEKQKEQKPVEWKPLPESMEALMLAIEGDWNAIKPTGYMSRRLEDLYDGLVNTFDIDEKYLDNLPKTAYTEKDIEEVKALKEKIGSSMEQKPADKIDPKFKAGDWISGYYTSYKVLSVNNEGYVVEDVDGNIINILFENEKFHHLWTIQDAKDGDVLVASDGSIFLFAGVVDCACKFYVARTACNGVKINKEVEGGYWETSRAVHPATKEQRDLLFQKMKEANYEWDAEKKDLKEIEQKPTEWTLPKDFEEAVYKVANFISPFNNQEDLRKVTHLFAEQLLSLAKKELDKPAEWSEEDERMRAKLLSYFNGFEESTSFGSREVIEIRHWLKSIRPVKQEWSDEDEKNPDREIPDCATCPNRGNTHQYVKGYEDGKKEAEQGGYERGYAKGYADGQWAEMWNHLAPPPTIPPYTPTPAPYPGYPVYQPDQWRVTCTTTSDNVQTNNEEHHEEEQ